MKIIENSYRIKTIENIYKIKIIENNYKIKQIAFLMSKKNVSQLSMFSRNLQIQGQN